MPNGILPPGYRAVLLGSATTIEGLNAVTLLEEGAAEGVLMLMRLDFSEYPFIQALTQLEDKLREAGVPAWPGYGDIVSADTTRPTVYLAWQKAMAWMPIIIGILIATLLPALLGAFVWWLIPEPIKNLITMLGTIGVMMLLMSMATKIVPGKEEPKRVKGAA